MSTSPSLHGILRGSADPRTSRSFEGRFGRIFRSLPRAEFSESALKKLAGTMFAEKPPESGIPAGYTYLGQFIDHDLTFG